MAKTWQTNHRSKAKKNNRHTKYDALAARRVLRDAYRAKIDFSAALDSDNLATIHLRWVTAVTILRAVGHALQKLDTSRSCALRAAIDSAWDRWKSQSFQHLIFNEFIEKERNMILKEYRSSLFPSPSEKKKMPDAPIIYSEILIGDRIYSPLEAIEASIVWWEAELWQIEAQAGNPNP